MIKFIKQLLCKHSFTSIRPTGKKVGVYEEYVITCSKCEKEKRICK